MNLFMKELSELLEKHEATILRSASEDHLLVVSLPFRDDSGEFQEFIFEEEISESSIRLDYEQN